MSLSRSLLAVPLVVATLVALGTGGGIAVADASGTTDGPLVWFDKGKTRIDTPASSTETESVLGGRDAAFSPDGTQVVSRWLLGGKDGLFVRHTDGTLVKVPASSDPTDSSLWPDRDSSEVSTEVHWAPSGAFFVVATESSKPGTGAHRLWKVTPGQSPVLLLDDIVGGSDEFAISGDSSRVYFLQPVPTFDSGTQPGGVFQVEIATRTTTQVTPTCEATTNGYCSSYTDYTELDGDLAGDVAAVYTRNGSGDRKIGWVRSGTAPQEIRAITGGQLLLSPTGKQVTWTESVQSDNGSGGVSPTTVGKVASVEGGDPVSMPHSGYVDWQPCPAATCPVFGHVQVPPGAPTQYRAKPGAAGGKVTATMSWTLPNEGSRSITTYHLQAAKLDKKGKIAKTIAGPDKTAPVFAHTWTTLKAGTYKFRIQAVSSDGTGPWSAWSNAVLAR